MDLSEEDHLKIKITPDPFAKHDGGKYHLLSTYVKTSHDSSYLCDRCIIRLMKQNGDSYFPRAGHYRDQMKVSDNVTHYSMTRRFPRVITQSK